MKKLLLTLIACFAVITANAWTVYFTNPNNWTTPHIYTWTGTTTYTGTWPGSAMTYDTNLKLWKYENGTGSPANIIFNDGKSSGAAQTNDLTFKADVTYNMTGPVDAPTYDHVMCYFKNTDGWSEVYIHTWDPTFTGNWPGAKLTLESGTGNNAIYKWVLTTADEQPPTIVNFMFDEGDGKRQTNNLSNMQIGATYLPNGLIEGGKSYEYTVYFENSDNWDNVYVYSWDPTYTEEWPGTKLEEVEGLYPWTIVTSSETTPTMSGFKFSNGLDEDAGQLSTGDITNYQVGATYLPNGTIKGEAVTPPTLYIVGGDVNGKNSFDTPADAEVLTYNDASQTYTWSGKSLSGKFKFNNGDWNTGYNIGAGEENEISIGKALQLYNNGSTTDIIVPDGYSVTDPQISLTFPDLMLTVNGTLSAVVDTYVPDSIIFKGSFDEWKDGFVLKSAGSNSSLYTGTVNIEKTDSVEFKLDCGNDKWYGGSNDQLNVTLENGKPTTLTISSSGNNWYILNWAGGSFVATVDWSKKSLTLESGTPSTGDNTGNGGNTGTETPGGDDGDDTGSSSVNSLQTANGEEVIYNLQGVRVNRDNLRPGIYIVNGRKVVVR